MQKEEVFENRRKISLKLIEKIRRNNGQMINAKTFLERPYYAGNKNYKFSTANYLRLLAVERKYEDPRWYKIEDIQKNNWELKEKAKAEKLEEWREEECLLTEFYNAEDIIGVERYKLEEEPLENVLEFLKIRGLIENATEIISLQDGLKAVGKYAEKFGADELTKILAKQMWLTEIKIQTKLKSFLPTFSEEILSEIEKTPEKIFEGMNKAQLILKNLRRERINPKAEKIPAGLFKDLKIVYHGSEKEIPNKDGATISIETILKGESAYEFLFMLKFELSQKIWLEISYKSYEHGKFLIDSEDAELIAEGTVTEFLRKRLDKNRQQILNNPQTLEKYLASDKEITAAEILAQVKIESDELEKVLTEFEQEENLYLEKHREIFS